MDKLIDGKVAESRSALIRAAWLEYKSKYTGEITLRSATTEINTLKGRLQSLDTRVKMLEAGRVE